MIKKLKKYLSPYTIKKAFNYLKHYGIKGFVIRLRERLEPEEVPYGPWYDKHKVTSDELDRQRKNKFNYSPKISIVVPAYLTGEMFLRQMINSVTSQSYSNWELCIADGSPDDTVKEIIESYVMQDNRIQYKKLDNNEGIAGNSNAGLDMATGEFIGLLDHDDLLAPNALYEIVLAINNHSEVDVIYTDEDKVNTDLSEHFQPNFKPDFNLDLLRANNYICHFFVMNKELLKHVGGFDKNFDGAQDYDLIFRCSEQANLIIHIPKILYHWRTHKASTADNPASKMYAFDAGKRAIEAHLLRMGVNGSVNHTSDLGFYRVNYELEDKPLVSIIIPNKDSVDILRTCINSINKSTYENVEVIIIENNSVSSEIVEYYKELESNYTNIKIVTWTGSFNFSAINNFGVSNARGEYVILLNNDIELISKNWIEEMLGHCKRKEVGIVGAKLYYPDNTIQHAGTIIGIGGIAGHAFVGMPRVFSGYMHKASLQQDLSAVTAACMMVKKEVYEEVGGLEEELKVAFNDVDFCLKVRKAGYLVVYNPYVEAYHHESKSRGTEDTKEKVKRFQSEIEFMRKRWSDILQNGDPYYNKNLTLSKWNYSLKNN